MDDLVQWLGEQLDEDEQVQKSLDDWHARNCESIPVEGYNGPFPCDCGVPARVLREIDAKRQIIERCTAVQGLLLDDFTAEHLADDVLALLALPYADRPGYREEWRP